jgi:aspartate beta-hydroxylase
MNAPNRPPLSEAVQLSPSYDAERLARELTAVTDHRWELQRISASGGVGAAAPIDWRVLPLRSPGGDADRTDPGGPGPVDFAPTVWLDRLPYLRTILDSLPASLNAVRLMALGPGASSRPHCDPKYALNRGMVRLHIPLISNPGAVLVLDGVEHRWQPGQLWYGDFSREHLVRNAGTIARVHTVIDALLTRELAGWFPVDWQAALGEGDVLFNRAAPPPMPCPAVPPYTTMLPQAFTDFGADEPLAGPRQPGEIMAAEADRCALAVAGRVFALAHMGAGEYRFAGWSEQRTLQCTEDGVLLRVRHGRVLQELHVAATADLR